MADNTALNIGSGGDTVRTLAKNINFPAKTQVIALDVGGGDSSTEALLVLGQTVKASSISVAIASDQNAVPVNPIIKGSFIDASGAITTGGTSQLGLAANLATTYIMIHNPGYTSTGTQNTNWLFFNFGVANLATYTSLGLAPGAYYILETNFISTDQINVMGALTNQPYVIKYL